MKKRKLDFTKNKYFRDIFHVRFDNRLRAYIWENHASPLVSIQVWVKSGSIHEQEFTGCGLSHFLEHMIFQGSENFQTEKIADIVENLGGYVNAYTNYGCTVYYINILSEYYKFAIDILSDAIMYPLFPEEKFQEEKNVILNEVNMYADMPDNFLIERLLDTMFFEFPMKHPIIGYKEKIKKVDRAMMMEYYSRRYTPERIFFIVCGDVDKYEVSDYIFSKTHTWQCGNMGEISLPEEPQQHTIRSSVEYFRDPLARIGIGMKIPPRNLDEFPVLEILSGIIGDFDSSRLPLELIHKKEMAIEMESSIFGSYHPGAFIVYGLCKPDKAGKVKDLMLERITSLYKTKISDEEIEKSVLRTKKAFLKLLKNNSAVAKIIGEAVFSFGIPDISNQYFSRLEALTEKEIKHIAEKYLTSANISVTEVFPYEQKINVKPSRKIKNHSFKPDISKHITQNNIRMLCLEDKNSELVDLHIILKGGTICEEQNNAGITHFLTEILFSGTKKYSKAELFSLLDNNGISLSVYSGANRVSITLNCFLSKLDISLELLRSILNDTVFDSKDFFLERQNLYDKLRSDELHPGKAADRRYRELLFGSHPYRFRKEGLRKNIISFEPEIVKNFFFNVCMNKSKAIIGVAGNVKNGNILKKLNSFLSDIHWNDNGNSSVTVSEPVFREGRIKDTVYIPRTQSVVIIGMPGCRETNDDRYALNLLSLALDKMTGRLFMNIREKYGMAYYTGFSQFRGIHPGGLKFYAGTTKENSEKVLALLDKERIKLGESGITQKEFKTSIRSVKQIIANKLTSNAAIIGESVLAEFYGLNFMQPWNAIDIYTEMMLEDTNATIRKYMNASRLIYVISTPEVGDHTG